MASGGGIPVSQQSITVWTVVTNTLGYYNSGILTHGALKLLLLVQPKRWKLHY